MQVYSNRNQDGKAIAFAERAGLKEGERALLRMNTGATISTPERAGELVTARSNVVTLHFCSSGWKYLERLPMLDMPESAFQVNIIGELPEGIPTYAFIEGEFVGTLRGGRLYLETPKLIRAATIPREVVWEEPWGHDWGRRTVPAFEQKRDFDEWFDAKCAVLREN